MTWARGSEADTGAAGPEHLAIILGGQAHARTELTFRSRKTYALYPPDHSVTAAWTPSPLAGPNLTKDILPAEVRAQTAIPDR